MPQASEELRAEWPGHDTEAIAYLEARGYTLRRDWFWEHSTITTYEAMEEREWSALLYLIQEWDFGGLWSMRVGDVRVEQAGQETE